MKYFSGSPSSVILTYLNVLWCPSTGKKKQKKNFHNMVNYLPPLTKERLADNKFREICVCASPTQSKKYTIKPVIPQTYHQPDALYP